LHTRTIMETRSRLLEIKNLSVSVGKSVLIRRFSYEFKTGTIVALIGDNGSGKTTLLKTIAGLKRDCTNHVFINGQDIALLSPNARARSISFLFQHTPE